MNFNSRSEKEVNFANQPQSTLKKRKKRKNGKGRKKREFCQRSVAKMQNLLNDCEKKIVNFVKSTSQLNRVFHDSKLFIFS